MRGEFYAAISQLSLERGISREVLISSVEQAVKAVFVRNYNPPYEVEVEMDHNTGQAQVYRMMRVAEPVQDPQTEISLQDARKLQRDARIGDLVRENINPPSGFGRIAAQMTKQVMLQKIREAEHETVYGEFADREGELVNGVVARLEPTLAIVELGKAEAIMPRSEQVESESYRSGQWLKVLLQRVQRTPKGPQIIVSRRDKNLLKRLFEIEVPEIYNGTVEIKGIARVAGERSKVAVAARQPGIDPVGSCVGVRGIRVQNVVDEVHGEKIDIIQWSEDPSTYIARALSPAQVTSVTLEPQENTATVIVPERQLSLAIGKNGQNARLAANLTGWRIDIRSAESLMRELGPDASTQDAVDAAASLQGAVVEESPEPTSADR
ncbi:MAG: transcription termination factor NusA [Chloroflexota bacterium]|nr:transcription termination factor NusA [Chloroflexota bacterium]